MTAPEEPPLEPEDPDADRPKDITAEQSVLGAMMLDPEVVAQVQTILTAEDFYRPTHGDLYATICSLAERGRPTDPLSVKASYEPRALLRIGGAPYLHTLISEVPTAVNAAYYAEIVADRAVRARMLDAGTRIRQLATHGGMGDTTRVIESAQEAIEALVRAQDRDDDDGTWLGAAIDDELNAWEMPDAPGLLTGYSDLDDLIGGFKPGQFIIIAGRPGMGKALALDTPLPTPTGWTTMGNVVVGDDLLDRDGRPTRVVAATEVMSDRPCYEVTFSDGTRVVADAEHQWLTDTRASRRYPGVPAAVRTTREIAETVRTATADRRVNHSIATCEPLDLPHADLRIPPYALGIWLGDGRSGGSEYTSADPEIAAYIEEEGLRVERTGPLTYALRLPVDPVATRQCVVCGKVFTPRTSEVRSCGRSCGGRAQQVSAPVPAPTCPDCGEPSYGLRRCRACHRAHGTVTALLRTLGVLGNKHIPEQYLRASEAQRRALLAGLLDSDGTASPTGNVQFSVTSERLARDTAELVVSLGLRCSVTTKRVQGRTEATSTAYQVTFTTGETVFRLERKRLAHKERRRGTTDARTRCRYIVDVRPTPSVPVRCVQVDNDEHLYLATRSMVPTHNSVVGTDWARHAAEHGSAVLHFSLEMSRRELMQRLISAKAKVRLRDITQRSWTDYERGLMTAKARELHETCYRIEDGPNVTLATIRAKARAMARSATGLDLLVVDYLQLLESGGRVESRQQEVSEFSRALKLLAKELGVPVVAIAQLNRGPDQRTDHRPMLSDLRESGSLEQDADLVLLINRPDAWERDDPRAGEADLILAKHRNGPTATITVAHQLHYARFADISRSVG